MVATFVSVLLQKMGSSTRWPSLTGQRPVHPSLVLCSLFPRPVLSTDYPVLEKVADLAIKEKQKFERLVVPKETLLEMFGVCCYSGRSFWNSVYLSSDGTVQQIQEVPHRVQNPRWHLHDRVPLWPHGRPLRWPAHPPHWQDQGFHDHQGKFTWRPVVLSLNVWQNSASYFLGDANNDSLQRVYGISFPDKKQLTEYKAFLAEAARRDHRKIAKVCCYT